MKKLISSIYRKIRTIHLDDLVLVICGIFLALLFRYFTKDFSTKDFEFYNKVWYETIQAHGLAAFNMLLSNKNVYNYSPMYLYLLYFVSILFPKLVAISAVKLISVTFDMLEAIFVYKLVRVKFNQGPIPYLAGFAFLFAPTILFNSSVWGQTDSIFTAFLLASLYFILKKQNWWACLSFGLAISMKFQAVFFAPFLFVLLLKREISWKQILLVPAVYFVMCIPAWIAGRPIWDLLTIYRFQVEQNSAFELNFPNIYYQLPDTLFNAYLPATLVIAVGMAFIYVASIFKSRVKLTRPILILLALVSVVFMPYFLPKMHDRYLYTADALSIVFGFYFPEYFYIPILINLFSFFVYGNFLFGIHPVPDFILELAFTFVIVYLGKITISALFPGGATENKPVNGLEPVDLNEDNPAPLIK
jgi:Gpi18-like mannosyltransferase